MALTYTAAAILEHAKLIEERIADLKENLTNRAAVPNYEAYSHIAGQIAGLRSALELCDEAAKNLNES